MEEQKNQALAQIIAFVENEELPAEQKKAKIVEAQASMLITSCTMLTQSKVTSDK